MFVVMVGGVVMLSVESLKEEINFSSFILLVMFMVILVFLGLWFC